MKNSEVSLRLRLNDLKLAPDHLSISKQDCLELLESLNELRNDKARLKSKIENLSTTFFHEHYGYPEISSGQFKRKVLELFN